MKLTVENFLSVAKNHNNSTWSDEELLESIGVLQCMVAYFHARKEALIAHSLRLELMAMESYATSRGWAEREGHWIIKNKE